MHILFTGTESTFEFTEARVAHPRLMNLRRTELAWNPQTDSNLKSPYGLLGQIDAVLGSELPREPMLVQNPRTLTLGS